MPNHRERIGWAREAADAYCKATRHRTLNEYISEPSAGEEVITDLMCDLRHLADSLRIDWTQAGTRAARRNRAELEDERDFAAEPDPPST